MTCAQKYFWADDGDKKKEGAQAPIYKREWETIRTIIVIAAKFYK